MLLRTALLMGLISSAHAQDAPQGQRIAVVIGLSSYNALPDAVELDFARSDAAEVAKALEDTAHFNRVFLLGDGEADRESIRQTLRTEVAQLIGPNDTFLLYFAGHGLGADLGIPTFLAYDSTLENGQEDGLVLDSFARDLGVWTGAGHSIIVTDAIHRNQLDGIYFYGPAATDWPATRPRTAIISSSESQEPAIDGAFGTVFTQAISGAADANDDFNVTVSEMFTFVHDQLGPSGQLPVIVGDFDPNIVISTGVERSSVAISQTDLEPINSYPDVDIDKAKFVFLEGQAQTVTCPNMPVKTCAPSCYVWGFKGGDCTVSAVIDGYSMQGEAVVLSRGRYECTRQGPNLVCTGP